MTFDASVGESATGAANRRLRSSLEAVFLDVRAQNADAAPEQRRELRAALREVCADARKAGLRAEHLLVLIKDVWSGLPDGISRVQTMRGDERLNYVITTCVDEYYGGEPRPDPTDGEAASETSP